MLWLRLAQDTPAITCKGDIKRVQEIVEHSLGKYFEAEQCVDREAAMSSSPDVRVDVCLYLIEPHQLTEVDIQAMKALGKFTSIVPLLAKVRNPKSGLIPS